MVALLRMYLLEEMVQRWGGSVRSEEQERVISHVATPGQKANSAAVLWPVIRPELAHHCREHVGSGVLLTTPELARQLGAWSCWEHSHPLWVLAELLDEIRYQTRMVQEQQIRSVPTIHPLAWVDAQAVVGEGVEVGPFAVIESGVVIGDGVSLAPHVHLYPGVTIGNNVRIGTGSVVGQPGFGWVQSPQGELRAMPHVGGVVVGDNVTLGAHVTVDAGVMEATRIARSCHIDSHVHVAHNVEMGEGCMLAAQSGIAGSSRIGEGVQMGGQVGVADHVDIGEQATIAAKSGVIGDVPAKAVFAGYPAIDRMRWLRGLARLFRTDKKAI
jgi:UDP-3-O-[3-hydroxymyristoyl] glucosamine N-acyltransferase